MADIKAIHSIIDREGERKMGQKEQIIRRQVSITNGELEVLKEWMPLSDVIHEDALVNGIVNQIIKRGKNDKSK